MFYFFIDDIFVEMLIFSTVGLRTLTNGGYVFYQTYYGSLYISSQSSIYLNPAQTKRILDTIQQPEIEPLEVILSLLGLVTPYINIPPLVTAFFGSSAIYYTCSLVNDYLNQEHIKALTGKASEQINIVSSQGKIVLWVPWTSYPTANISDGVSNLKVVNTAPY